MKQTFENFIIEINGEPFGVTKCVQNYSSSGIILSSKYMAVKFNGDPENTKEFFQRVKLRQMIQGEIYCPLIHVIDEDGFIERNERKRYGL